METSAQIFRSSGSLSPLLHSNYLLTGSKPFTFPPWSNRNVLIFDDLYDKDGIRSFQNLKETFSLPGTSYFMYLRIRSALRSYGVPWDSPLKNHPLVELLTLGSSSRGLVSSLYSKFISAKDHALGTVVVWEKELSNLDITVNWDVVWNNVFVI